MSDDQVWNAFIKAIPAQDKARHDLENFQARLLKNARTTRAKVEQQIVAERKVAEDTKPRKKRSVPKRKGS